MKKPIYILIFYLLFAINLNAQKETYNWFFGLRQGATFNTTNLIPDWITTKIDGRYACSSISDNNGNFLFYTNGVDVFNSKGGIIGNIESDAECAIIIKRPNSESFYYIFHTLYRQKGLLFYSTVDMSLNEGDGQIIDRTILLDSNIDVDKLTATYNNNGKDIWLAAHKDYSNIYYLYLINDSSVYFHHADTVGRTLSLKDGFGFDYSNDGTMKFSPNGKKIGLICHHHGWGFSLTNGWLEVLDFNNKSGKISNPIHIDVLLDSLEFSAEGYKGIEFSPDSKKLYAFARQFDISLATPEEIAQSAYKFISTKVIRYEAPFQKHYQLGPDGKIYFIGDRIINYIEDPNESGSDCNLKYDGTYYDYYYDLHYISMDINDLPQFITNWFEFKIKAESNSEVCEESDLELFATNKLNARYFWTGPNGLSSNEMNPVIKNAHPSMTGWYYVTAQRRQDEISTDSVFVIVNPKPYFELNPKDTAYICELSSIWLSAINTQDNITFFWSTGDTSSSINVSQPGTYYLITTDTIGCTALDSVVVIQRELKPEIEIIGNYPACEGDTLFLRTKEEYIRYKWSTGDSTREITVTRNLKYTVEAVDSIGCKGESDESPLLFFPPPKTTLKGSTTVCFEATTIYYVNKTLKDTVIWEVNGGNILSGFGTDTIIVNWNVHGTGKVLVKQVSLIGCIGMDSLLVDIIDEVKPEIVPPKPIICGDGTASIKTSEQYEKYLWSTGDTTEEITVDNSGDYWVKTTAPGGCFGYDTITVIRIDEPIPVINGQTSFCPGESTTLNVENDFVSYFWSTGDSTKNVTINQAGIYSVEVTDSNGCKGSSSVLITEKEINLSGLFDIDFGRISIDSTGNRILSLINISNFQIRIEDIKLKSGNGIFIVNTIQQTPAILDSGEVLSLNLIFLPDNFQEYNTSLIIEISEPCPKTLSYNIEGSGTGNIFLWIPFISSEVGKDICIPLFAKMTNKKSFPFQENLTGVIRFDATAFMPENNCPIIENNRVIDFKTENIILSSDTILLTELCGTVLLANKNSTEIKLTNITLSSPHIDIETSNGNLKILGCAIDISRVSFSENFEVVIFPNPTDEELTMEIKCEIKTPINIIIYNSFGMETMSFEKQIEIGGNILPINISGLTNGIYFIKIRNYASETINLPLVIMK